MKTSDVTNEIQKALADFKKEMPPVKRSNDVRMKGVTKAGKEYDVKYEYAPLELIQEQARPFLSKNGLSVTQMLGYCLINQEIVYLITTRICHSSGQFIQDEWPIDLSGISKEQDRGSKITYNKRYCYTAALDIALWDEDDDAINVPLESKRQEDKATEILNMSSLGDYVIKFGTKMKGKRLREFQAREHRSMIDWLKGESAKSNKPINGPAQEYIELAEKYITESDEIPF